VFANFRSRLVPKESPNREKTESLLNNVVVHHAMEIRNQWKLTRSGTTTWSHPCEVPASAYISDGKKNLASRAESQLILVMHDDYSKDAFPLELAKSLRELLDVPEKHDEYVTMILSPHILPARLQGALDQAGIHSDTNSTESNGASPSSKEPEKVKGEPKPRASRLSSRKTWAGRDKNRKARVLKAKSAAPSARSIEDLVCPSNSGLPPEPRSQSRLRRLAARCVSGMPLGPSGQKTDKAKKAAAAAGGAMLAAGSWLGYRCLSLGGSRVDSGEQLMGELYVCPPRPDMAFGERIEQGLKHANYK
jgi:hypothetical protein